MSNPGIKFSGYLAPFAAMDEEHPLFHLFIEEVASLWPGNKIKVSIDILELDTFIDVQTKQLKFEGSTAPKNEFLAGFEATLVRRDNHTFYFTDIKPAGGEDYSKSPEGNIPWFKLKFCVDGTIKDNLDSNPSPEFIIPVLNHENASYEGSSYEIGFTLKNTEKNNELLGDSSEWPSLMQIPRFFLPASYYTGLMHLDSIHSIISEDFLSLKTIAVQDNSSTALSGLTETQRLNKIKMDQQKAADKLLKDFEEQHKDSSTYYGQYFNKMQQYQKLMCTYSSQLKTLDTCKNDLSSWNSYQQTVMQTRNDLEELKKELDDYTSKFGFVPEGIKKATEDNIKRIKRVKEIDNFLKNPMVKVIALLPYGGTITGFAKILQGKYLEGMIDLGFALLQYGALVKLKSLAYQFENFEAMSEKPFMAVQAMIASKYAKAMTVGGPNAGTLQSIAEALAPDYAKLCKFYNNVKALDKCENAIRDILKYRETVQTAIKVAQKIHNGSSVTDFAMGLRQVNAYGNFLLIVNSLKTINKIRTIPDSFNTTLNELEKLGEFVNILPDSKECKPASNGLRTLFKSFSNHFWTTEQVINDPSFPEIEIQKRVQEELRFFTPPHLCANSKDFLISRLNELISRIQNESTWRTELKVKGKINELIMRASLSGLETEVSKFCGQLLFRQLNSSHFKLRI